MPKTIRIKLFVVSCVIVSLLSMICFFDIATGQEDPFDEIQQNLKGISEEEREVLQTLFLLAQEIEEMKRREGEIGQEIKAIYQEVKSLEDTIAVEESAFERKRDVLEQVLKSYQRKGPGSFLEILLESDNLSVFLRRINTFRDLTRNTGELLTSLEESKGKLSAEKVRLSEKMLFIEGKQQELRVALEKKEQLIESQESYLASLAGKRAYYQEYLTNLQKLFQELGGFFETVAEEFVKVVEEGNIPSDALKTTITFMNITGTIDEKTFNDIIKANPRLPEMTFRFLPGKIEMTIPEKNLLLIGNFAILEGNRIEFAAEEGTFFGMPLEAGALEALIRGIHLILDLKPLIGKNILHAVEILEGKLTLKVIPIIF